MEVISPVHDADEVEDETVHWDGPRTARLTVVCLGDAVRGTEGGTAATNENKRQVYA
jgi:hypothetical protein